jgi:hypothetical protein
MIKTKNRPAVTLTEVLIAIFLMGIGLMAILSLFPLGASQMAQALQDQRAAEAATMAAGYARVIWKQACDADTNTGQSKFYDSTGTVPQSLQRFVEALDNPTYNGYSSMSQAYLQQYCIGPDQGAQLGQPMPYSPPSSGPNAMPQMPRTGANQTGTTYVSATGASYPVLLDPIGWQSNAASPDPAAKCWLPLPSSAGVPPSMANAIQPWRIPRRPLYVRKPVTTVAVNTGWVALNGMGTLPLLKQFSLMDDMTFNYAGTPDLDGDQTTMDMQMVASQGVRRQGRYSWAYMFRRANNADRTAVDITTILYSGRSVDVASQETAYAALVQFPPATSPGVTPSTKTVTLFYAPGSKPALRRGNWILDATLNDASMNLLPQGVFYRVVNVDDSAVTTPPSVTLELQSPIMGDPYGSTPRQPTARVFVVMDKVIEVFTKKDVSNVAPPMPY